MYKIYDEKADLLHKVLNSYSLDKDKIEDIFDYDLTLPECNSPELEMIVDRIYEAKENNEKVFIAGDYDSDGVLATVILKDTLDFLKIANGYYIPSRASDGYGLSKATCEMVYAKGYNLIITVDNGVKQHEAIEYCNSVGLEIIITDHHQMDEELDVVNILHPSFLDEYFMGLCGTGLALLISNKIHKNDYHIVLAMIATIGDMMELFYYNRKLVRLGLKLLHEGNYPTITKLFSMQKNRYDETDIAFNIVPKINAVGRMSNMANANNLVKYFLTTDAKTIEDFAKQLESINNIRKNKSKDMIELALKKLDSNDRINFVYDESFDEGICGLVAGAIVNKTNKPTIVLCKKADILIGSGRSVLGFDIYSFLKEKETLFSKFGGHKAAVGLTLPYEKIEELKKYFQEANIEINRPDIDVIKIQSNELSINAVKQLNYLRPFGMGLPKPLFYSNEFKVTSYNLIKDKYPKWSILNDEKLEAISFDINLANPNPLVFVGNLQINIFKGKETLSFIVKDTK